MDRPIDLITNEIQYDLFCWFLVCNCDTVTISLSGDANALSFLSGDYQQSTIINGHPSWVNSNYGIWYYDGYKGR